MKKLLSILSSIFARLHAKWIKRECPHICYTCEFKGTWCNEEWWKKE